MRCEAQDAPSLGPASEGTTLGQPNKRFATKQGAQIRRGKWGKLFLATSLAPGKFLGCGCAAFCGCER